MTDVHLCRPYADDNMQAWENFFLFFSQSSCRLFSHLIVQLTRYNFFFFWFDLVYSTFDLSIKVDRTLENVTIKQTGQIDSLLLA